MWHVYRSQWPNIAAEELCLGCKQFVQHQQARLAFSNPNRDVQEAVCYYDVHYVFKCPSLFPLLPVSLVLRMYKRFRRAAMQSLHEMPCLPI